MSLLGGELTALFGTAFGAMYLDGTLHSSVRTEDGGGSVSRTFTDSAIKVQLDSVTEAMRLEPGYTARDVRLIILQYGAVEPSTEDEITAGGRRWALGNISADPANTHWTARGTPA